MGSNKKAKSSTARKRKGVSRTPNTTKTLDEETIAKMTDVGQLSFMHRMALNAAIRGYKMNFKTSGPYQTLHFLDGAKAKTKLPDGDELPPLSFWHLTSGNLVDLLGFNHERFDFTDGYLEGTTEHILQQLNVKVNWGVKVRFGVFECPTIEDLHKTKTFHEESDVELLALSKGLDFGYIELDITLPNTPLWVRRIREDGVPIVDTSGAKHTDTGEYTQITVIDHVYHAIRAELSHEDYEGYELFSLNIELTILGV